VTAFSSVTVPDKKTDQPLEYDAPDLSVGCIKYASGVVARLTCSIIAPHDHRLMFVGEEGILWTKDTWHTRSPVYVRHYMQIRRKMMLQPWKTQCKLLGRDLPRVKYRGASKTDWGRGIAEMADAIIADRPARLCGDFSLHINELTLALHNAGETGGTYRMTSTFAPMEPLEWARPESAVGSNHA
jgi:hypothetical protein